MQHEQGRNKGHLLYLRSRSNCFARSTSCVLRTSVDRDRDASHGHDHGRPKYVAQAIHCFARVGLRNKAKKSKAKTHPVTVMLRTVTVTITSFYTLFTSTTPPAKSSTYGNRKFYWSSSEWVRVFLPIYESEKGIKVCVYYVVKKILASSLQKN